MPMPKPCDSDRLAWLEQRRTGIGGSDVAAILGLSKWKTPLDVWKDQVEGGSEEEPTPSIEWGVRLEPVIRQKYSDVTGLAVECPQQTFRHPEHGFMIANIDGICSDGRLLEIKTARTSADWGEEGTDEIPDYYLTQVQHYMAVLGKELCDVAVLIGASDFRIYTVKADPELQAMLIREEAAFWKKVEERTPPAPRTYAETASSFPSSRAQKIEATDEVFQCIEELDEISRFIALAQKKKDDLMTKVTSFMGEADTLVMGDAILATWKTSKPRVSFDSATFKVKHPDLYTEYLKLGAANRRFLLKYKTE